jgi:mono/diheme cytochrome c family protein
MNVTHASRVMMVAAVCGVLGAGGAVFAQAKNQWEGIYTADQARRGQALYADACAVCHGATLTGGEMAPALTGSGFDSGWNGFTVADLVERTRSTMPQDKPGSLTRAQVVDIVAFMLSKNDAPVGQTELPSAADQLAAITFAPRP